MSEEKTFEFNNETYTVKMPSNKIRRESDRIYATSYRQAIHDGYFLEAEVEDLLKSRDLDEKSLQPRRDELNSKLRKLESKLKGCSDKEAGKDIAEQAQAVRKSLEELEGARNELANQTANSIAENKRFSYYAYACVTDPDGDRIWDDFEEFLEDDSELAILAATEIVAILYDATKVFIQEAEKNKFEIAWKIENGFLDSDLNEVDPSKAKPVKKTTQRKKRVSKKTAAAKTE